MKKGFTLVELLAVIIILALLSLVIGSSVIKIVNNAKKELSNLQIELIKSSAELWSANNIDKLPSAGDCIYITLKDLSEEGILDSKITDAINNKEIPETLKIQISSVLKKNNNEVLEYTLDPLNASDCVYANAYKDESGANVPELMDSLTPVIYEDGSWQVADSSEKWYDYNNQEWANAVILKEGVSKDIGTKLNVPTTPEEITSSDILAMFVWIPRYEYKIDTTDGQFGKGSTNKALPGEIEVNFISKSQDKATEGYIIHPGFTFGSDTLSGIWVGKFETSHETLSASKDENNLGCSDESCTSADGIRILPNVMSLRYNNVANFFFATRSMSKEGNIFKIDKSKTDTHMMKNSEWGAVAYLSQSKYGKYGNTDYQDANKEVYKNNSSSYITGKSGGNPSVSFTSEGTCSYNENINGTGASTTGNIYGIYDMSGGSDECVMGYYIYAQGSRAWGSTAKGNYAGFTSAPNSKYFDAFTILYPTEKDYKGYAFMETSGWYSDNAYFINSNYEPWILRGGDSYDSSSAGLFSFTYDDGESASGGSFHIVFAPTT